MISKTALYLAFTVASSVIATSPAPAYDPCERATQDYREAFNELNTWSRQYCGNRNPCYYPPYGAMLYNRMIAARDRASRACN